MKDYIFAAVFLKKVSVYLYTLITVHTKTHRGAAAKYRYNLWTHKCALTCCLP